MKLEGQVSRRCEVSLQLRDRASCYTFPELVMVRRVFLRLFPSVTFHFVSRLPSLVVVTKYGKTVSLFFAVSR